MLTIRPVGDEDDFQAMCSVESAVAQYSDHASYTVYPSQLVFDRYMYGGGATDIFAYGRLLSQDDAAVGYALIYIDESKFAVRLLPQYVELYEAAVTSIGKLFSHKSAVTVIANELNAPLCDALLSCGFVRENEERWQAGLDLTAYEETDVVWQNEVIRPLAESDIDDRVKFADVPTGCPITRNMYESLRASGYYKTALDYVIRGAASNEFIGFVTWWIDENSKTATLEPVACLPEFRRRGIMKRALLSGLNELKRRDLSYVYVSTSIRNERSQPLYHAVGFQKIGTACRYVKESYKV